MKIESIIEGLNKHIEEKRSIRRINAKGHLVLQKKITPHPTFPVYKEAEYILWYVKGKSRYTVLGVKNTFKSTGNQEEKNMDLLDVKFCNLLINWIGTVDYGAVIKGEYGSSETTSK